MKNYKTKQLREMLIYKLQKEIKNNLFQLNKDELIIIIKQMQSMINKEECINQEKCPHEVTKDILWEYIPEKDISEIERRIRDAK